MKTTKTVNLDINKKKYDFISSKQGDNARYLLFRILDNGVPFSLQGKIVKVFAIKPDGKKVFNNTNIIDSEKGLVEVQLTTQMLAVDGILKCELTIFENGEILSTMPFEIDIITSVRDENAILSTNEFSVLMNVIENGKTLTESLKPIVSEAKPLYENLNPVVEVGKELNASLLSKTSEADRILKQLLQAMQNGNLDNFMNKAPTRLDNKDLNTISDPGRYVCANCTNVPTTYGRMDVLVWNDYKSVKWITQIFYSDVSNKVFTRCSTKVDATAWTPWAIMYSSMNKPTPDDIGASPSNHNHDSVYLGRKGEINSSTDFNTITEAGMYKVQNITASTPNSPIKAIPNLYAFGILLVFKSNVESEDRVLQIYYPHQAWQSTKIPISRMKNNNDWTPWERVTNGLTASDVGARSSNWNPTWNDVQDKPSNFPPSDHNHDDRYLKKEVGAINESFRFRTKYLEFGVDDSKLGEIGVGPSDTYIHNTKSNKYLALKDDGRLLYNNKEVCDRGHFTGDPGLNGYQMFPSGLLVQWGYVDMGKDTTKLVNFPKSFKDNNYNLQVSVYGGPGRVPAVKTYYAKNNNFYIQCEAGFCVYWEAKGSV